MFRLIILLGAAVIPFSAAQAQAAWDFAPRWICRGDKTANCDNTGACKNGISRAIFDINFAAGTITNLSRANDEHAKITLRKFSPATSYGLSGAFKGSSYFITSEQQAFLIEEKSTEDILEPLYRLRMITSYGDGDVIHYGTCIPRTKE